MKRTEKEKDHIVLLGKEGSGKSTALNYFLKKKFTENIRKTMCFKKHDIQLSPTSEDSRFNVWDTSGQKRFAETIRVSFTKAKLIVVFIDLTDIENSIDYFRIYKNEITSSNTRFTVVYSKRDHEKAATLTAEMIETHKKKIANNFGLSKETIDFQSHSIISSKTGEGVDDTFHSFLKKITYKPVAPFNIRLYLPTTTQKEHQSNRKEKEPETNLLDFKVYI